MWGVNASYEHHWNAEWKTSLYGGYIATSYNDNANAILCGMEEADLLHGGFELAPNGACNNDWSYWDIGSRTQWNVTKDFYLGLDVVYTKLNTANDGNAAFISKFDNQPTSWRSISDQDAWIVNFRVHKDFYP
jgi:hypothetical protein